MPDYNLGKAHGTIKIDYDKSGAENAREDIKEVGDEATRSSEKIDKSTKESTKDYEALADSARKASESLNFNSSSADQMGAAVKKLEKDVSDASAASLAARSKLEVAEENLRQTRERGNATAGEVTKAEEAVRRAQAQLVSSTSRLESNVRALSSARERLNRIPKPPDPTPDVDNNVLHQFVKNLQDIQKNTSKNVSILNSFSGRLKLVVGGVAVLTPTIAGLAVSLASLAGLAGVAAGALASLGAVGGTLATGLTGVGDAFKAASQQAKAAGGSAGASAKAQRAAARSIEDAKRSLISAEQNLRRVQEDSAKAVVQAVRDVINAQRDLQNAQRDAVRAQQDLNKARQQAVRDLEDMQFALTGGSLDERQAALDVKQALQELQNLQRDPTANADDIERATINYEKQKLALDEARKSNQRLAVDSAAAAKAGVAGSDAVVNAQDGVRNATQAVADAQQSLVDAQDGVRQAQIDSARQIADAVQGVIDAQRNLADAYVDAADAGGAAGAKLNDAMANLSPNARAFVGEVLSLKGAWDDVRKSVQDKLFAGLAAEVKPLASIWFPLLKTGMGQVATGLNGIIKETVAYLKTTEAQQNVANIFKNTGLALGNMKGILRDLLAAFLDIASVGSDFLPDLATGAANAAKNFRDFVHEAKETGRLKEWMQGAMDTAGRLWQLIKNIGDIIGTVFSAIDTQGGGALNTLTNLTGKIAEFLHSAEGQDALKALGRALAAIGGATGKVFLSFLDVAATVLTAIEPLITAFADAAGTYLAGALQVLKPVLEGVATVLGFLGPALGPVIAGIYAANKAIGAAKVVWQGLNAVMKSNPFLQIAVIIITLVLLIIQNWDSISAFLSGIWQDIQQTATAIWTGIRDFFVGIWNDIKNTFNTIITSIRDFFVGIAQDIAAQWNALWTGVGNFFSNIGNTIKNQVKSFVDTVVNFFRELPGKVWDFVKSLPEKFWNLGKDIVSGILRGLGNLASALWTKLKNAVSAAWDSVLDFFGIGSPSKLAAEAGKNIVAGLVRGIDNSADSAVRAAANMAQAVGTELTGASGTLATTVKMNSDTSGLPKGFAMDVATNGLASVPVRGGDGATASRTIVVDNVNVYVQGNLDPTNPTAFRNTMVRLKNELRDLDKEYK